MLQSVSQFSFFSFCSNKLWWVTTQSTIKWTKDNPGVECNKHSLSLERKISWVDLKKTSLQVVIIRKLWEQRGDLHVLCIAAGGNHPSCSIQVLGSQAIVRLLSNDLVNFMVLTCLVTQREKGSYHGQARAGSTDPRWRGHLALHRAITPFTQVFPCAKPNG